MLTLSACVPTPSRRPAWAATIGTVVVLLVLDFLITRKPHEVSLREATLWSAFYVALPLAFGAYVWSRFGSTTGVEYLTGYLVEKSLSVDNLFVFMLLLGAFAVPVALQQRVLLYGIVGALLLRAVFIALGAAALHRLSFTFLLFGADVLTAVKVLRDQRSGHGHAVEVENLRSVRLLRRFLPVTREYHGARLLVRTEGVLTATPFALVVVAVLATDVLFAVDSVPPCTGSPATRSWSSRPTPSPCWGCARCTSCCRARCRRSSTSATGSPRSWRSSA